MKSVTKVRRNPAICVTTRTGGALIYTESNEASPAPDGTVW